MASFPTVDQAAFATVTTLAVATGASAIAAATTASTVALVAYAALAITGSAVSIASISAWLDTKSTTVSKYFENVKTHSMVTFSAMLQFVTQTLVKALVDGLAQGIFTNVKRRIAGPDVTYGLR